MKKSNIIIFSGLLITVFMSGILVSSYELFPYGILKSIKNDLMDANTSEPIYHEQNVSSLIDINSTSDIEEKKIILGDSYYVDSISTYITTKRELNSLEKKTKWEMKREERKMNEIEEKVRSVLSEYEIECESFQSNSEGEIIDCSPKKDSDLFGVAVIGVGAAGILSTVTLQLEDAFNLHAIEKSLPFDFVIFNIAKWK